MKKGSITIDVDTLKCYYNTYGIKKKENSNIVFTKAIPRFLDLFEELKIKATFFVVGKDALKKCNKPIIKKMVDEGHEIANHSLNHIHHIIDLSRNEKEKEILNAGKILRKITKTSIVGYRSPGYNIDEDAMEILEENDYEYDSSINPTFFSPMIKLAVIALSNGKNKSSGMGKMSYMLAPTIPYNPRKGKIWKKGNMKINEYPVSVSPYLRFPFFASALFTLRILNTFTDSFYDIYYNHIKRNSKYLNFELHAIELSDINQDNIDRKLENQPSLKIPVKKKYEIYKKILGKMKNDFKLTTLKNMPYK